MDIDENDTIAQQIEILQDENVAEIQAIFVLKEQLQRNLFDELNGDL